MSLSTILHGLLREAILPPTGFMLMFGLGLIVRHFRRRAGNLLCGFSLALLLVLSTNAGADLLVRPLEARVPALTQPLASDAQAIVVLAAGRLDQAPEYQGQNIPDYIALARLRYAAHLAHLTHLPVLVSGANLSGDPLNTSKAAEMAQALREDFQVPVTWLDEKSENTEQNARYSAQLLKAAGVERVLLVTDAMHMPRARLCFEQNGMKVTIAPTMFFTLRHVGLLQFMPSAEGLRRSYYAMYEWLGLLWYSYHS